jgi:hypothetical protein
MNHSLPRSPFSALALVLALAFAAPAPAAPAGGSAKPRAAVPAAAKRAPDAARRLEDVHIEGELEVPRITFITVRQPHRFTDFTRPASVRSSRRMADGTACPAWISPAPKPAPEARKENRK